MTMLFALSSSTTRQTSWASKDRPSSSSTVPPPSSAGMALIHIPVPCIKGQHEIELRTPSWFTAATNAARSSRVAGGEGTAPAAASAVSSRSDMPPCGYITPLGIPVVPPV